MSMVLGSGGTYVLDNSITNPKLTAGSVYGDKVGAQTIAGTDVFINNDTILNNTSENYTKMNEFSIDVFIAPTSTLTFTWSGSSPDNNVSYSKWYKNGVAVGTQQNSGINGNYNNFSEDITFTDLAKDDLLQLYTRKFNGACASINTKLVNIKGTASIAVSPTFTQTLP